MAGRLSAIESVTPELIATAELVVETRGEGFTEITREAARFVEQSGGRDGALFVYLRHTSASLTIQENADPDVQTDLTTALRTLAPDGRALGPHRRGAGRHAGARQGHADRRFAAHSGARRRAWRSGTWQGLYLVEHRSRPHRREVVLQFVGSRA